MGTTMVSLDVYIGLSNFMLLPFDANVKYNLMVNSLNLKVKFYYTPGVRGSWYT